jgi:deazaflavin-dependent oxidoreductase (nitroreductase family)
MAGYNDSLIADLRAHGKVTQGPFVGRDVLLITTTGARSGNEHTNPVVYSRDGDRYVIVASKGGAPTNPGWFHNLRAHPTVTVELEGERFSAQATVVSPESERRRLYAQHSVKNPGFREYEKKTTRRIPVIWLDRER